MTPRSPSVIGPALPSGNFVDAFDGRYYRITGCDALPVFFMNVVGASDFWLFLASNGGLTAGRTNADHALFPYQSVDRICDAPGTTGPFTAVWVSRPGASAVHWEPLAPHGPRVHAVERNLYRSVEGDRVWFEEINRGLGLAFRYGWVTTEDDGIVRRCELENLGGEAVAVRLLDGLRNLLPAGIPRPVQDHFSCLADAFKTAELLPGSSLAVYALSTGIVDRPVPLESLRATTVWSSGLPEPAILLSETQVGAFHEGRPVTAEHRARGVRCVYAAASSFTLPPAGTRRWLMAAEIGVSQSQVVGRWRAVAAGNAATAVRRHIASATRRLRELVAAADGLQWTADEMLCVHHFANVLFNIMRGGVPADAHELTGADFAAFVASHNRDVSRRCARSLAALPARLTRAELLARVAPVGDADLSRLAATYLPLTFSRRHGDPSRPWNRFHIHVRDTSGRRVLGYEGNWRDIFQNWEALGLSHPAFLDAFVAQFLCASSRDGYNPYRISHRGIDWEVPEADDPWSSIGYWGDHQVVYLAKLLEWTLRFQPDAMTASLRQPRYSFANIPYRVAPYAEMRRHPQDTVSFDETQHAAITERARELGSDARLLTAPDGRILHVNLTEKLLIVVLARMANFVAGAGLWMNTGRPEWNDANNALVGQGVSMVTLCYLRRLAQHWRQTLLPLLGDEPVPVSDAVAHFARDVRQTLEAHRAILSADPVAASDRRSLLDALGTAGCDYRERVYAGTPTATVEIPPSEIAALLDVAVAFIDHTIRGNRRDDGLYHAYNLLEFTEAPAGVAIYRLPLMLEGQVAVLSAGLLSPGEAEQLLTALRGSALYRADQHSYLLNPDRDMPAFLARNVIPDELARGCRLLREMVACGDERLVSRDETGCLRFHADLGNDALLQQRLAALAADPRWSTLIATDAGHVRALYEQVFHHASFTGRSGSMFGYEGLGCVYWHMVAKLLLAIQENVAAAERSGDPVAAKLRDWYFDVRSGLGFNKSPVQYGAFPFDPYSHTPAHSGAQQPGMTGQVKEEILTRFGELGVEVEAGRVTFRPRLLRRGEFTSRCAADPAGSEPPDGEADGTLAFTLCGTPVAYHLTAGAPFLRVRQADGACRDLPGLSLDAPTSAALFARNGSITHLRVALGGTYHPLP